MGIQRRRRRLRHTPESDAASTPAEAAEDSEPAGAPSQASEPAARPQSAAQPTAQPAVRPQPTSRRPPRPAPPPHRPSPQDLAGLNGTFALTSAVHDPEPEPERDPHRHDGQFRFDSADRDEVTSERGLRGLVGGGSSQVSVRAAMRARDAARPSDAELARAAEELMIVRRGWVPREDLPRPGRRQS